MFGRPIGVMAKGKPVIVGAKGKTTTGSGGPSDISLVCVQIHEARKAVLRQLYAQLDPAIVNQINALRPQAGLVQVERAVRRALRLWVIAARKGAEASRKGRAYLDKLMLEAKDLPRDE